MRSRFHRWVLLSMFVAIAGACFWKLGRRPSAEVSSGPRLAEGVLSGPKASQTAPIRLLSQPGLLNSLPLSAPQASVSTNAPSRLAHRLSNTSQTVGQLARKEKAILLENALLDTESAIPAIPAELQAEGDPGTYIVQAKGPIDDAFRKLLQQDRKSTRLNSS